MRAFPSKAFVLDLSEEDLAEIIHQSTSKRISDKRVEYLVDKLIGLAKQSYCATKKTSPMIEEVRYYAQELVRLSDRRQAVLDEMVKSTQPLPEYEILLSIPGIAETTATSIIGELGDIRRFQSSLPIKSTPLLELISDTTNLETFWLKNTSPNGAILMPEKFSSRPFTTLLRSVIPSPIILRTFMRNEKDNRRRLQLSLIRLPQCIAS